MHGGDPTPQLWGGMKGNITMTDTSTLSAEEIMQAFLSLSPEQQGAMATIARDAAKAAQAARVQQLSKAGAPFLTDVIANTDRKVSGTGPWVGHSVSGLTVEVDGVAYTASLTITDSVARAARNVHVLAFKESTKDTKFKDEKARKAALAAYLIANAPDEGATDDDESTED